MESHPAGTLDNSDKCGTIKSFWFCFYDGGLWELFFYYFELFERK